MSGFSRDWLKLREPADLAARSAKLARRFAENLLRRGRPLRLVDLGAGTGANARALMPRLAGDQEWILVENDPALIAAQEDAFATWARRQGYPIRAGGGRIEISGAGQWHVRNVRLDLAAGGLDRLDADAVTAAAFFDLVSDPWLNQFAAVAAERRWPLLAALTVDGRREWKPILTEDKFIADAFGGHQRRDKGFGPALGPAAGSVLDSLLKEKGFLVETSFSDWRLEPREPELLAVLVAGEAAAAAEEVPGAAARVAAWAETRRAQLANGKLSLTIGHHDLLSLPR